jgi:hypothetical protein
MITPQFHHTLISVELLEPVFGKSAPKDHRLECAIRLTTESEGEQHTQDVVLPITWQWKDQARHAEYYEAILQIRDADDAIVHAACTMFDEQDVGIAKIEPIDTGVDIYAADKHRAGGIARQLKKRFGGEVRFSKKLAGVDHTTGSKKYRVTILYRGKR